MEGQWFFVFSININGDIDSEADGKVEINKIIRIPLFTEDEVGAERQAKIVAKKIGDRELLKLYCDEIESEDSVLFDDARILFEKRIDVEFTDIEGGL